MLLSQFWSELRNYMPLHIYETYSCLFINFKAATLTVTEISRGQKCVNTNSDFANIWPFLAKSYSANFGSISKQTRRCTSTKHILVCVSIAKLQHLQLLRYRADNSAQTQIQICDFGLFLAKSYSANFGPISNRHKVAHLQNIFLRAYQFQSCNSYSYCDNARTKVQKHKLRFCDFRPFFG